VREEKTNIKGEREKKTNKGEGSLHRQTADTKH